MARLLVFWTRPRHLSSREAEDWARTELRALLAVEGVERAALTRLAGASPDEPHHCDWMLELHLAPDTDGRACMRSRTMIEWLADLRLLGMRPSAVLAQDGRPLTAEDA